MMQFLESAKGELTQGFEVFTGVSASDGNVVLYASSTVPIPAGSDGELGTLLFEVDCPACREGDQSELWLERATGDLTGIGLCNGLFTYYEGVLGDPNEDGVIGPDDADCIVDYYLHGGEEQENGCYDNSADYSADVNCDQEITPADALLLQEAMASGQSLPLPCQAYDPPQHAIALVLPDSSLSPGAEIEYPILIDNPLGLRTIGLQLHYPAHLLEFHGLINHGVTHAWEVMQGYEQETGHVTIGGYSREATSTSDADTLFLVQFTVKPVLRDSGTIFVDHLKDDLADAGVDAGKVKVTFTAVQEAPVGSVSNYYLEQNHPNPFNSSTEIKFSLARPGKVTLTIYDLLGRCASAMHMSEAAAGWHVISWDGNDQSGNPLPSGIYIYELKVNGFLDRKKLTLVR